jgi:hypothetical protein
VETGGNEIAPQHVRIALVVEDIDSLANQFDGLRTCPIGEFEAMDAILASRKPTHAVPSRGSFFYRISKVAIEARDRNNKTSSDQTRLQASLIREALRDSVSPASASECAGTEVDGTFCSSNNG